MRILLFWLANARTPVATILLNTSDIQSVDMVVRSMEVTDLAWSVPILSTARPIGVFPTTATEAARLNHPDFMARLLVLAVGIAMASSPANVAESSVWARSLSTNALGVACKVRSLLQKGVSISLALMADRLDVKFSDLWKMIWGY